MRKLLTLDFDGVISPFDLQRGNEWRTYSLDGSEVSIRKDVITFLQSLRKYSHNVDVCWLTSWNESTLSFEKDSQGDIPRFSYVHTKSGKTQALEKIAKKYDRILAVDDELKVISSFNKVSPLKRIDTIITDSDFGLTNRQMLNILVRMGCENYYSTVA